MSSPVLGPLKGTAQSILTYNLVGICIQSMLCGMFHVLSIVYVYLLRYRSPREIRNGRSIAPEAIAWGALLIAVTSVCSASYVQTY